MIGATIVAAGPGGCCPQRCQQTPSRGSSGGNFNYLELLASLRRFAPSLSPSRGSMRT